MWWTCPNCNEKVDFAEQMHACFENSNDEAYFAVDEGCGILFHTIQCKCGAYWTLGMSGMETDRIGKV